MDSIKSSDGLLGQRAVVVGASMAGLLAARVLSERFAQVVVLERDELPHGPSVRKGTPQVAHSHGLLARGRLIIEALFPGYTQALCDRGAKMGDAGRNVYVSVGGQMLANASSGESGIACSRLLIEDEVRRRVRAISNVQLVSRVDVQEPIFDVALSRVTGVRMRLLDGTATPADVRDGVLAADLVIDCTGRGSRAPQWLRNWGFDAPEEERVSIGVGYITSYFVRTEDQLPDIGAAISTATAEMMRPAVMIAQEPAVDDTRKRWVVTLAGFAGDHPEATLESLMRRAPHSGSDAIAKIVREAEPIGSVLRYGFPHSQRRRYERLRRFPERFLAMGDAIASFNPIYGQGMTVAACEALALRDQLSRGLAGIHRPFFRQAAKVIDNPWQISVGADLAIPTVQGARTARVRFINAYMRKLFYAARFDATVSLAFKRVTHLLAPPPSLFAPHIVLRVLWRNLTRRVASEPTQLVASEVGSEAVLTSNQQRAA